jgi:hypothetical protein
MQFCISIQNSWSYFFNFHRNELIRILFLLSNIDFRYFLKFVFDIIILK